MGAKKLHPLVQSYGIVPVLTRKHKSKFLLIQHHAGHWGFPKGKADDGETALQAARREFEEETGVRAYDVLALTRIETHYLIKKKKGPRRKRVTYFVAVAHKKKVKPQEEEIRDFAWLEYEEALARLTFEQCRQVLKRAARLLKPHLPKGAKSSANRPKSR